MACEITWDEVKAVAKVISAELEAFTTVERDLVLEEVYEEVPAIYGDPLTKILRRYYAAHVAANQLVETAGEGAFTSETIGSVVFGKNQPVNNPQASEEYYETVYGRRYESKKAKFSKRNVIAFGVCVNGDIQGLPRLVNNPCST